MRFGYDQPQKRGRVTFLLLVLWQLKTYVALQFVSPEPEFDVGEESTKHRADNSVMVASLSNFSSTAEPSPFMVLWMELKILSQFLNCQLRT